MDKFMNLLLKAPTMKAGKSAGAMGVLLMAFGWLTTDQSIPQDYRLAGVITVLVLVAVVHAITVLSNPNGDSVKEPYISKK